MDWKKVFKELELEGLSKFPGLSIRTGSNIEMPRHSAVFVPDTMEIVYTTNDHWKTRTMRLVHELAHVYDFFRNYNKDADSMLEKSRDVNEIAAYLYGWGIIKRYSIPIDKNAWKKMHSRLIKRVLKLRADIELVKSFYERRSL